MIAISTLLGVLSLSSLVFTSSPVCYPPLGCFPNDGVWRSPLRPFFPPPQSPENVGTRLFYFNRNNLKDGVTVYEDLQFNMDDSGFDPNLEKTFFIVHGFVESGNSSWMSRMKDSLLLKVDSNVFVVDWGKGADQISYAQAASDTRIVGAEIGRFIKHLHKHYSLKLSKVHLIGHSLGAQITSYAAKNVTGIGRVTGLDAAQPGFEGLPKEARIDKSDAKFVDLIHTNMKPFIPNLGLGMFSAVGHVDIYVNGGLEQPGCKAPDKVTNIKLDDLIKIPIKVFYNWGTCSHQKSVAYFEASINAKCKIWAHQIKTFQLIVDAFTNGIFEPVISSFHKCNSKTCTVLGLETTDYESRGVFAASTTRQYPYCDEKFDV